MGRAVPLRDDFDAGDLRRLAKSGRDPRQIRRLLACADVYNAMSRADAAMIGGVDGKRCVNGCIGSMKMARKVCLTTKGLIADGG